MPRYDETIDSLDKLKEEDSRLDSEAPVPFRPLQTACHQSCVALLLLGASFFGGTPQMAGFPVVSL